MYKKFFQHNQL